MKHFKKMMALVIAMVMVVATMNFGSVFAAPGDKKADTTISIDGLDDGDQVNLYQVLEWESGTGWVLAGGFAGNSTASPAVPALDVANVNKLISPAAGQGKIELTREDLEAITTYAKTNGISPTTGTVSGTTYTKTVEPGMYLALVAPKEAGVVYNPIVISADFDQVNTTNSIDASHAVMGSSSVAKKKKVTVDKSEGKITNNIGDTYHFTITTTIPLYSKSFVNPFFNVTDQVTEYLDIDSTSIVVKVNGNQITDPAANVSADKHTLTLEFDKDYLGKMTVAEDLVVTYDAKLAITPEEAAKLPNAEVAKNEVTIRFPNNPKDDKGRTVLKDGTRERTFTIDGTLLGHEGWQNSELMKVGKDINGSPVVAEIAHSNGQKHAALDGALFGLFKTQNDAQSYKDSKKNGKELLDSNGKVKLDSNNDPVTKALGFYTNDVFDGVVTSANGGLMYIPGLDAGTYYLYELSAPDGYIKDQKIHPVTIEVTKWDTVQVTEYYTISGNPEVVTWYTEPGDGRTAYTYDVKDVAEYSVTFDDLGSTSYSMELSGPYTSTSKYIKNSDAEIANTEGVELPSTGGIGTTIFYIIGAILVLGAGILLVTRRRMNAD